MKYVFRVVNSTTNLLQKESLTRHHKKVSRCQTTPWTPAPKKPCVISFSNTPSHQCSTF